MWKKSGSPESKTVFSQVLFLHENQLLVLYENSPYCLSAKKFPFCPISHKLFVSFSFVNLQYLLRVDFLASRNISKTVGSRRVAHTFF